MVVAHVVLQLVAARELLTTSGTAVGRLGHPVEGAAELTPALAGVHHVLDLQKTVGDLDMGEVRGVRKVRRVSTSGLGGLALFQSSSADVQRMAGVSRPVSRPAF